MGEITIVDVPEQKVMGMYRQGSYKELAEMIPELCEYADKNGAGICGSPIFICHESPEEAKRADKEGTANLEVAIPVSKKIEETNEIKYYELHGGKMLKIIHKGPYEDCGATYDKIFQWLKENRKELMGPTREVYINDPREISPEEILTEIYAPIA